MGNKTKKTLRNCIIIVVLMFGFSFALVPLYDVLCKVTDLNGKVDISKPTGSTDMFDGLIQTDRVVTVEFDVTKNEQIAWKFKPEHIELKIHPGQVVTTTYYAKNLTNRTMTVQAIPSISPWVANRYFRKIKCFCFRPQTLAAGASENMLLQFVLDPSLPQSVKRLTLSYTIFDFDPKRENPHANEDD
ncbi:MAG: cytochrome c oxidase assembly protein [Legionellales bacterium]|nr:MAG: cytochrome c oxidase assembly protein [Legionellales bacterium]